MRKQPIVQDICCVECWYEKAKKQTLCEITTALFKLDFETRYSAYFNHSRCLLPGDLTSIRSIKRTKSKSKTRSSNALNLNWLPCDFKLSVIDGLNLLIIALQNIKLLFYCNPCRYWLLNYFSLLIHALSLIGTYVDIK